MRDLYDWAEYYGEKFTWYSAFPLNSLLPSRVTIATGMNFKLIKALCTLALKNIVYVLTQYSSVFIMCLLQFVPCGETTRT